MKTPQNISIFLGGASTIIQCSNSDNLNTKVTPGLTYTWSASVPDNAPYDYGTMKVLLYNADNTLVQMCFRRDRADMNIVVRQLDGNTWKAWKRIVLESIT